MAQNYDKIVKENLSDSIPFLAKTLFGLDITNVEPVKMKLQHTIEREPDFLARFVNDNDENRAIQFEFQTTSEKTPQTMIYRFMLYKALGLYDLNLCFEQYVVYIGNDEPKIDTFYDDGATQFRIQLIDLKTIDYEVFYHSTKIEEVVFAILADFKNRNPEILIKDIIERMKILASGELDLLKHAQQLRILSNLRNLEAQTTKILTNMPILIDITQDSLYKKGAEKGLEQGLEQGALDKAIIFIIKLFLDVDFSNEKIANLTNEKMDFIEKLRKEYDKTNIAKVLKRYDKKGTLDKRTTKRKAKAIAKELLKMPSLTVHQVSKIVNVELKEIQKIKSILTTKTQTK